MPPRFFAPLAARSVLLVSGEDRRGFLQGLVSSDTAKVTEVQAQHAGFLTAQGRFLHEFFMADWGDAIALDCEAARRDDLAKRLKIYKLRAKVALEPADGFEVAAFWGEGAAQAFGLPASEGAAKTLDGGRVYVDPRLASLGVRAILPAAELARIATTHGFEAGALAAYDELRIAAGVPDGSRDLQIEDALLLENGFDELRGVDFKKGCYVGQEVTARMKYRGLVKKRLLPVAIAGPAPAAGTPILLDGAEAGEMRSSAGAHGLALLRLEAVEKAAAGAALVAGGATLTPRKPAWANF